MGLGDQAKTIAVHSIHFPISARSFIVPLVDGLNAARLRTELWVEDVAGYTSVLGTLPEPKRVIACDLPLNPWKFWKRLAAYRRALREVAPLVLHAHQTRASLIPLLAARLERIKFRIYHNHGLPYLGYRGPLRWALRLMERLNIGLATHMLLVSFSNLEAARKDGLLRSGQGVVLASGSASGIDLGAYSPLQFNAEARRQARGRFGIDEESFALLYIGRPVARKGFHLLLRAWEGTGLSEKGAVLLVAGCGQADADKALGRPIAGVQALGYVNDMRSVYAAADAVTLPSRHEGFPYSMLEGSAAGRALIGTNLPGLKCAIIHDKTGLLLPPDDVSALIKAIRQLAEDPQLRTRLGSAGRVRVEQEFSRPVVLEALIDFYKHTLGVAGYP